jgi:peptide/nickel transport system permease protein
VKLNPKILDTHPDLPQILSLIKKLQPESPSAQSFPKQTSSGVFFNDDSPKIAKTSHLFSRTIRYLLVRVMTISTTIFIGVFITVILANRGGQIDASVRLEVEGEVERHLPPGLSFYFQPTSEQQAIIDQLQFNYEEDAGLHLPFLPRHLLWTLRALKLDIGNAIQIQGVPGSAFQNHRARDIILSELPHSLMLVGSAFLFIFIFGIPLALYLFRVNGSRLERLFAVLAPLSSIPSWVWGVILVLIFAVQFHWLPPSGMFDPIPPETTWDHFSTIVKHMVLPVLAIILSLFFQLVYSWKSLFLLYANEDYVDLAKAKGLPLNIIERRHILQPSLPYMITNLTLLMVTFWQMTFALEYIFNWPGIGRLYILSLPNFFGERMFTGIMPIVVGIVVIFAYILGITVFLLDIVYGLVDPRVRVGGNDQTMRLVKGKKPVNFRYRSRSHAQLPNNRVLASHPVQSKGPRQKRKFSISGSLRNIQRVINPIKPAIREIRKFPSAIFGLLIIFILVGGSIYAVVAYPYNKLGGLWYSQLLTGKSYTPKLAQPIWVNWFRRDHLPSTIILDSRNGTAKKSFQDFKSGGTGNITLDYVINYPYNDYPQDLTLYFINQYDKKLPFVTLTWITPDNKEISFGNFSPVTGVPYHLSDDPSLRKILPKYPEWQKWFIVGGYQATPDYYLLFSDPYKDKPVVLPGRYILRINVMTFEEGTNVDAELVLLGKVYGLAGTDYMRRDLLVPLLWGMPFALALGLIGASVTTILSMIVAATGVWYGGWLDNFIQRIIEGIMILPVIAIGVIFYAYFNMSIWTFLGLIAVLNVFGSPTKSFRAAFLQVREAPFIEAAEAAGASNIRIILHYLVPSIIPILIPQLITLIPSYVFLEATLGLFGVNSLYPTWGKVIYDALRHGSAYGSGYWVLEPISLLLLTGLAFTMLGFALERILNPRMNDF